MSKEKNDNLQYSYLAEQGDLGLWNTPLNKEDNQKVNDFDRKKDNEEKSK